jgi:uncharacterized protein
MSDLCLACGLCCSGVLFSTVDVQPDELPLVPAERLGLKRRGEKHGFDLPCTAHLGDRCTVYPDRPTICRSYECGVLRDHEAGKIDLGQAQQIVAETRQRARDLGSRLPAAGDRRGLGLRLRDLADAALGNPNAWPGSGELLLDAVVLSQLIRKHFVRRKPEAGPMSAAEVDQPGG